MQRARAEQRGRDLVIHLNKPLNQDHLETVSGGQGEFYVDFEVADPRRARVQQRRLFFALLHDIETYFVVPSEFLKSMFYTQYEFYTAGKSISLSDTTESSVSDANTLLDLVIDFMFEWHVPFKKGYELLPREEQYFIYQCLVCGEHADIHHVDVVGRTNRNKIDHSKRHVLPLCRVHHSEIESITPARFSTKYHVPVDGIKLSVEDLKQLGIKGSYGDDQKEK